MSLTKVWKDRGTRTRGNRKTTRMLVALAAVAASVWAVRAEAQQAAVANPGTAARTAASTPPAQTSTIHATVELVNVPVTALTKHGQRVIDLQQDEVKVFEDGVEQKITHFERETQIPMRIGLIVDTSNSARTRLPYEKDAAQQFVDMILASGTTRTQLFIETFDASSSVIQDFTSDPDLLSSKIEELKAGGGKALYDAIYAACRDKMMKTGPREEVRRVLIILSDGLDVESQHTLDQAVSMARMAETMIFTVGTAAYGFDNPGDKLLAQMSTETGGYSSFPLRNAPGSDVETGNLSHGQIGDTSQNTGLGAATGEFSSERLSNLVDALQTIGHDLSEEYNVSYRPLRDAMDGTYRSIKVETTRRGVVLRWKPGYFATPE